MPRTTEQVFLLPFHERGGRPALFFSSGRGLQIHSAWSTMPPMPEPLISSEPSDIRPPRERLARMLVISLAVHLVIFSAVLLSPQGGGDSRTVAFVDLTMPAAGP